MNQTFTDLYQLIWKEVFPKRKPLPIEQFKKLYTKDLELPAEQESDLSGEKIYLSPFYRYSQLASQDELMARDFTVRPKQKISSLKDVLASVQDISYFKVGRSLNSDVVVESDNIYSSNYVYRSTDLHGCQKMMFCNGNKACEYLLASKGNGESTFGIRLLDSGGVSNSFDMHWCGKSSNCYFCMDTGDLRDCMFCFHITSKRFCIGNMQFEEQEYHRLKKKILDDYFAQLDQPDAFVTLSDL